MLNKVKEFISSHSLLQSEGRYLIALSGGADSVALLLVLRELGYSVEAMHCNFNLRGEESLRDEQFCVSLCSRLGVTLHRIHFDTREYASLHKVSIEMAARELRYAYFNQLRQDLGADGICVAHHRDDSVETVLLNLVRGTGLRGLRGIQPLHDGIIRPLLAVSRQEIETYLLEKGQDYVTDSTNLETDFQRNRIRLQVLPLLRELNPAVSENIFAATELFSDAQMIIDDVVDQHRSDVLDVQKLDTLTAPRYLLYEVMKDYGFTSEQVSQMYRQRHAESGREYLSPTHACILDRGRFVIEERKEEKKIEMRLPETGTYVYDDNSKLCIEKKLYSEDVISKEPSVATLDAAKVTFPLTLRRAVSGDRFCPFGMKGSRLLSDYLTDKKRSVFEKRRQLVVTAADGNIVWVVGERTDDRYRVGEGTGEVLVLTVLPSQQ